MPLEPSNFKFKDAHNWRLCLISSRVEHSYVIAHNYQLWIIHYTYPNRLSLSFYQPVKCIHVTSTINELKTITSMWQHMRVDPSTRWQRLYDHGVWKLLINPLIVRLWDRSQVRSDYFWSIYLKPMTWNENYAQADIPQKWSVWCQKKLESVIFFKPNNCRVLCPTTYLMSMS